MAAKVTAAQIRKIHVLAKGQGMDSDLLHLYIHNMTRKSSIAGLSVTEAVKVIDGLAGKRQGEAPASRKQIWKIEQQMKELGWTDENGGADKKRLNGFLKERFSVDHHQWITKKTASDVIEALKAMLERQKEEVC